MTNPDYVFPVAVCAGSEIAARDIYLSKNGLLLGIHLIICKCVVYFVKEVN